MIPTATKIPFNLEEIEFLQETLLNEKRCFTCDTVSTIHWYTDSSNKKNDIYNKCYLAQRRALSKSGALGKTCSIPNCQTTSTTQWHKDPSDKQKNICQRCYDVQRKTLPKARDFGRICSINSCQATSTKQWYKDSSDKQKDICKKCYQARKRALSKTDEPSCIPAKKKPKIL